jgi:hypothetical protein
MHLAVLAGQRTIAIHDNGCVVVQARCTPLEQGSNDNEL